MVGVFEAVRSLQDDCLIVCLEIVCLADDLSPDCLSTNNPYNRDERTFVARGSGTR